MKYIAIQVSSSRLQTYLYNVVWGMHMYFKNISTLCGVTVMLYTVEPHIQDTPEMRTPQ